MLTNAPRGTYDALPGQVEKFQHIEEVFRQVAEAYGYREIRTPVFEHTELFERGVGDTTDIVQKEMYTFTDKGDRSITLRPEGTSPVARAFVEHGLYGQALPFKFYYCSVPILRYEKPQAGRLRQHHQLGVEAFGSNDPKIDAEVIALLYTFYKKLGLKELDVQINSVGCPDCRNTHREALHEFLSERKAELCEVCQDRFERNPMRILDCKNEHCQVITENAPVVVEHLCDDCAQHYDTTKAYLNRLQIPFVENHRLVRGLDYYTNTAFEIIDIALEGAENVIGGGGRYNGLVKEVGGPDTPGIGFGTGVERLELACNAEGIEISDKNYCQVFFVTLGAKAEEKGAEILQQLRASGIKADMDYMGRSMRSQMKHASRLEAEYTVIIGENELEQGKVVWRDMQTGEQEEIALDAIAKRIVRRV